MNPMYDKAKQMAESGECSISIESNIGSIDATICTKDEKFVFCELLDSAFYGFVVVYDHDKSGGRKDMRQPDQKDLRKTFDYLKGLFLEGVE